MYRSLLSAPFPSSFLMNIDPTLRTQNLSAAAAAAAVTVQWPYS